MRLPLTATVGVYVGRPDASFSTTVGPLQLEPPSLELVNRTSSSHNPVLCFAFLTKLVELSQTTSILPLPSMATSSSPSPTRRSWPVFGSWTPRLLKGAMICGCVQWSPPSVDLTNASWALLCVPRKGVLGEMIRSVKS